jgi:hypothetical protein
MARATREQCIFLFVEGDSEEVAIPILLADSFDLDSVGVRVANYNGHGNMKAALRLLKQTLSHSRPVIVTYDNDPVSRASLEGCRKQNLLTDLTYELSIPADPAVVYPCGHRGGGFEESFPVDLFLDVAFREMILPREICAQRGSFESIFDSEKPWLRQIQAFAAKFGFNDMNAKKKTIARALASEVEEVPSTYRLLADLVQTVRSKYPVIHPDDVESPQVQGMDYYRRVLRGVARYRNKSWSKPENERRQ